MAQVIEGNLVLRLDPRLGIGRVGVLQTAVRIGDLGAVVVVDLVDLGGGRVVEAPVSGSRRGFVGRRGVREGDSEQGGSGEAGAGPEGRILDGHGC